MYKKYLHIFRCGIVEVLNQAHFVSSRMPFYAVARGRSPGVFQTWGECEVQVKGFSGARYKKFNTESEAREFIQVNSGGAGASTGGYQNVRNYSTSAATYSNIRHGNKNTDNKVGTVKKPTTCTNNNSFNIEGLEDSEQIEAAVSKHLDAFESRLEDVKNNVEKIYSGSGVGRGKRTLLIEPPEPNKRRRKDGDFHSDDSGVVQVYTDGACSSNGQKDARAGYGVWWGEEHPLNTSAPVSGRATNNCGEIQAAARACQLARDNGIQRICINTDSKFLIDSFTKWLPGWKRNGYRTASGAAVKNEEDFRELERAAQGLDVQWRYVEAHRGIHGNEQADRLARAGAALHRP